MTSSREGQSSARRRQDCHVPAGTRSPRTERDENMQQTWLRLALLLALAAATAAQLAASPSRVTAVPPPPRSGGSNRGSAVVRLVGASTMISAEVRDRLDNPEACAWLEASSSMRGPSSGERWRRGGRGGGRRRLSVGDAAFKSTVVIAPSTAALAPARLHRCPPFLLHTAAISSWSCVDAFVLGDLAVASFDVSVAHDGRGPDADAVAEVAGLRDGLFGASASFPLSEETLGSVRPSAAASVDITGASSVSGFMAHLDYLDRAPGYPAQDGSFTREDTVVGAGVTIYVLDTGIDSAHPELAGRVEDVWTVDNGTSTGTGRGGFDDANGHGTLVASVAAGAEFGIAPGATVGNVNVYGAAAATTPCNVARGLRAVYEAWSAQDSPTQLPPVVLVSAQLDDNAMSGILAHAAHQLVATTGAVVVVAAGNADDAAEPGPDGDACRTGLGPLRDVLAVGSAELTSIPRVSSFSRRGPCVGIFAPGERVWGAKAANGTAMAGTTASFGGATFVEATGTSPAAAQAAGVAALAVDAQGGGLAGPAAACVLEAHATGVVAGHAPTAETGYTGLHWTSGLLASRQVWAPAPLLSPASGDKTSPHAIVSVSGSVIVSATLPAVGTRDIKTSGTVTVALSLPPAAAAAGLSLSTPTLSWSSGDWDTEKQIVVAVDGDFSVLGEPLYCLTAAVTSASGGAAPMEGAVSAFVVRDLRPPATGDTPRTPFILDPGVMGALGGGISGGYLSLDVLQASAAGHFTASYITTSSGAFSTCEARAADGTIERPTGPEVLFAFNLAAGCGPAGNSECAMRWSSCGPCTGTDTTLQAFAFDAPLREPTERTTPCSDNWPFDEGCVHDDGVPGPACLATVAGLGCTGTETAGFEPGTYGPVAFKSAVHADFAPRSWYLMSMGTWERTPFPALNASWDEWECSPVLSGVQRGAIGLITMSIAVDNPDPEAASPELVLETALPEATPVNGNVTPPSLGGRYQWEAIVSIGTPETTWTKADIAQLESSVMDVTAVNTGSIHISVRYDRRRSQLQVAASPSFLRRGTQSTAGAILDVALDATTEVEANDHAVRLLNAVADGSLETRTEIRGLSVGPLTAAEDTILVRSSRGPDAILVDVPIEVVVYRDREVAVNAGWSYISQLAAILFALFLIVGVAIGAFGYYSWRRSRGPDENDLLQLYRDKDARAILAGALSDDDPLYGSSEVAGIPGVATVLGGGRPGPGGPRPGSALNRSIADETREARRAARDGGSDFQAIPDAEAPSPSPVTVPRSAGPPALAPAPAPAPDYTAPESPAAASALPGGGGALDPSMVLARAQTLRLQLQRESQRGTVGTNDAHQPYKDLLGASDGGGRSAAQSMMQGADAGRRRRNARPETGAADLLDAVEADDERREAEQRGAASALPRALALDSDEPP